MRSAADGATHHAEQRENQADHHQDDADRPQNRDLRDKTNYEWQLPLNLGLEAFRTGRLWR